MKKHFISLLALLLVTQICSANVITGVAVIPDGYYSSVDHTSSPTAILDALNGIISGHTVIPYDDLEPYYQQTDFYSDTLWDMYSTCRFVADDANKQQSALCDGWNKEHVCCQSWLGSGSMVSDLYNVYPTDARVNNLRSNYPYGEVNGPNGTGITKDPDGHALGKRGSSSTTISGYSDMVFEPHDNYKGDFARTFMYMVARYRSNTLNSGNGSVMFVSNKTDFTTYAKNLLMKWHRNDPVSQKEIDRNQAVYGIQKNRNPFIDYPDLAEYIWGDRVGQSVDLSSMTPTCDGGGYTPAVVTKYGVTWVVNGEELQVDSVAENKRPTALPAEPTSCSSESNVFVGWANAPISGYTDDAPVLYSKAADIPAITADISLYAVFAKASSGENVAPATYTYAVGNTTEGWINTASLKNDSYWLLETGKTITSPELNLAGLSSITVIIRTYGGTGYNQLNVKANGTEIATIEAAGKSLAEQTWTNSQTLTGSAPIEFSSSYGSEKGIGISSITINATGASVTYSRYITSCQSATEVETVTDDMVARKLLIGGHVFILIDNQLFNLQGQRVK